MTIGAAAAARALRATTARLCAQALERAAAMMLRWVPHLEAWYDTYARRGGLRALALRAAQG